MHSFYSHAPSLGPVSLGTDIGTIHKVYSDVSYTCTHLFHSLILKVIKPLSHSIH